MAHMGAFLGFKVDIQQGVAIPTHRTHSVCVLRVESAIMRDRLTTGPEPKCVVKTDYLSRDSKQKHIIGDLTITPEIGGPNMHYSGPQG